MSLMESLNDNRTKVQIVPSPTTKKGKRKREERRRYRELGNGVFRERVSHLSLDFREIRPSKFVGTRRKVALPIETYMWAPVLGVFDKLREVGDLSYLGFTLYLSVL